MALDREMDKMGRMETIDIHQMIDTAANAVRDHFAEHRSWWSDESVEDYRPMVRGQLLERIWAELFSLGRDQKPYKGDNSAPSAVAELIRNGLDQGKVSVKRASFRVSLPHLEYRIRRRDSGGYTARPNVTRCFENHAPFMTLPPAVFAQRLFLFDSAMPEIERRLEEIQDTLKEVAREVSQERIVTKIRDATVESLARQFLEPLGIDFFYGYTDDGMVHLVLTQMRQAHLDIPLADLAAALSDTDALMMQLRVVKPSEVEKIPRLNDGILLKL